MNAQLNRWYRVPEVWLIIGLLGATMIGSLALVASAMRHPDELLSTPKAIATALPPDSPAKSTDPAPP
jgi:hypothetical protein